MPRGQDHRHEVDRREYGGFDNPSIRCRLVGKEFRTGPDDALFASTPSLEALRLIISRAATVGPGGQRKEIMINDVSRAYFYARCTRDLYIELPKEDPEVHPISWASSGCAFTGPEMPP